VLALRGGTERAAGGAAPCGAAGRAAASGSAMGAWARWSTAGRDAERCGVAGAAQLTPGTTSLGRRADERARGAGASPEPTCGPAAAASLCRHLWSGRWAAEGVEGPTPSTRNPTTRRRGDGHARRARTHAEDGAGGGLRTTQLATALPLEGYEMGRAPETERSSARALPPNEPFSDAAEAARPPAGAGRVALRGTTATAVRQSPPTPRPGPNTRRPNDTGGLASRAPPASRGTAGPSKCSLGRSRGRSSGSHSRTTHPPPALTSSALRAPAPAPGMPVLLPGAETGGLLWERKELPGLTLATEVASHAAAASALRRGARRSAPSPCSTQRLRARQRTSRARSVRRQREARAWPAHRVDVVDPRRRRGAPPLLRAWMLARHIPPLCIHGHQA
jgi:hypothetical protein